MEFEQADELLQALRTVAVRHRALTAAVLARLNLHPGQEVILLELAASKRRSQAELAVVCGAEPPTISVSTRKLEEAGLVRRRPSERDARASIVELTDDGRALVPQLMAAWTSLAERTVAELSAGTSVGDLTASLRDLGSSIVAAEHAHAEEFGKRRAGRGDPTRARVQT